MYRDPEILKFSALLFSRCMHTRHVSQSRTFFGCWHFISLPWESENVDKSRVAHETIYPIIMPLPHDFLQTAPPVAVPKLIHDRPATRPHSQYTTHSTHLMITHQWLVGDRTPLDMHMGTSGSLRLFAEIVRWGLVAFARSINLETTARFQKSAGHRHYKGRRLWSGKRWWAPWCEPKYHIQSKKSSGYPYHAETKREIGKNEGGSRNEFPLKCELDPVIRQCGIRWRVLFHVRIVVRP